jgi:hypothetical protein
VIKLTNASEEHKGNLIYINPYHISAVYEFAKEKNGSLTTMIYGGYAGVTWEVEESLGEVLKLLKQTDVPHDWF